MRIHDDKLVSIEEEYYEQRTVLRCHFVPFMSEYIVLYIVVAGLPNPRPYTPV